MTVRSPATTVASLNRIDMRHIRVARLVAPFSQLAPMSMPTPLGGESDWC
jgi:hypothetical protein